MRASSGLGSIRGDEALQLLEPVQDDVNLQCDVRFDRFGHDEAAVRSYVIVGAAHIVAGLVLSFEQHDGDAQSRCT